MSELIERTSLCYVTERDRKGNTWLMRVADISAGELVPFIFKENEPWFYENRNRLFFSDSQTQPGVWGVWDWTAETNYNDPDKDFVKYRLNQVVEPVEIITTNTQNLDELKKLINDGVQANPVSHTIIIAYPTKDKSYTGFLCHINDYKTTNNNILIEDKVLSLSLVTIINCDIVNIENRLFYRFTNPPAIIRKEPRKNIHAIIKEIIKRRSSWSVLKANGLSKNEWKKFNEFLAGMPDTPLYEDIELNCNCSEASAKEMVDNFINNACKYIKQDDIESNVLEAIINTHPALKATCEKLAAEQWRAAHVNEIAAADEELQLLVHKNTQQQQQYVKLVSDTKIAQDKYTALQIEIDNLESLGKDVEQKTQLRIENARKNAADFISSLAFIPPYTLQNAVPSTIQSQAQSSYETGAPLEQTKQDISPNWETTLDYLSCELRKASVKDDMAFNFAAFIYSAIFVNHSTLLMAGPYGTYIANAFSTVLFGRKAGCLDCSLKYNAESINNMLNSDDKVVIIKNPLNAGWVEHITECLCSFDKHFILTYPFAEDLLIEPRGLFNYMLPVLTEFVIDVNKVPSDSFIGSVNDENYVSFDKVEETGTIHPRALQQLNMGVIVKQRIQHILFDAHTMSDSFTDTDDYLFSIFPYACATGQSEKLSNILCETPLKSNEMQTSILDYLGVDK